MIRQLQAELQHFPRKARDRLAAALLEADFCGIIAANLVTELMHLLSQPLDELLLLLLPFARVYASAPVSHFRVGAIAQGETGALYFGANIEFSGMALNATVHAEQAATLHAWFQGEKGLQAIAVNEVPCGHCRQFLAEVNEPALKILTPDHAAQSLNALLPNAFGPSALGNDGGLLHPVDRQLERPEREDDGLVRAAWTMAKRSYAPYSGNYAGVAVRIASGQIVAAPYAENVAFNPSLSPLQGVLISLRLRGLSRRQIREAVLVERKNATTSQEAATRTLLEAINTVELRTIRV